MNKRSSLFPREKKVFFDDDTGRSNSSELDAAVGHRSVLYHLLDPSHRSGPRRVGQSLGTTAGTPRGGGGRDVVLVLGPALGHAANVDVALLFELVAMIKNFLRP
jgi:hypothetical protein